MLELIEAAQAVQIESLTWEVEDGVSMPLLWSPGLAYCPEASVRHWLGAVRPALAFLFASVLDPIRGGWLQRRDTTVQRLRDTAGRLG